MKLPDLLSPEQILLGFEADDKWAAIAAMPAALVRSGHLAEEMQAPAVEALISRERKLTTGMEDGIAIPHAALDGLPRLLGVLCLAPEGIPFGSLDGAPGQILVGLLIPRTQKLQHIRTLAEIARLLSVASVRADLLAASSPEAAMEVLQRQG